MADEEPDPSASRRRDPTRALLAVVLVACLAVLLVVLLPGVLPQRLRDGLGVSGPRAEAGAAGGAGYAFLAHQPGDPGSPVRYDPCEPIRVQVDPAGGPATAVALVQRAMARVGAATGLRFDYVGLSTARPEWRSAYLPGLADRDVPVLVSWATAGEVPQLRGGVAGIGGSVWMARGGGERRYVTGEVTLDSSAFEELGHRPDADAEEEAIVLHEFGHLVGLAHVDDPGELMYLRNVGRADFGAGDLAGLARLGGRC